MKTQENIFTYVITRSVVGTPQLRQTSVQPKDTDNFWSVILRAMITFVSVPSQAEEKI